MGTLAALALSGCSAPGSIGASAPSLTQEDYLCGGVSIPGGAVADRVPVAAMEDAERDALAAAQWDDGTPLSSLADDDWYRANATDDTVTVIRDVETPNDPTWSAILPDREILTVSWVDGATNLPPGWYVSQSSPCALTVDLGDLQVPALALRTAPDPESRELALSVTEMACNSGEDAQGRIEVVSVEESADQVRLVLGTAPRGGVQNCPSNPATPFTVTLDDPVGDREIINASLVDPRPVTVAE